MSLTLYYGSTTMLWISPRSRLIARAQKLHPPFQLRCCSAGHAYHGNIYRRNDSCHSLTSIIFVTYVPLNTYHCLSNLYNIDVALSKPDYCHQVAISLDNLYSQSESGKDKRQTRYFLYHKFMIPDFYVDETVYAVHVCMPYVGMHESQIIEGSGKVKQR